MVDALSADDILSRFLLYDSEIDYDEKVIKLLAINKKHPEGFSVFRTNGICEQRVWALGKKYVEPSYLKQNPSRPLKGYFNLSLKLYQQAQTSIQHAPNPHPRHYNIHGMPIPATTQAGQILNLRQKIVREAKLFLPPNARAG